MNAIAAFLLEVGEEALEYFQYIAIMVPLFAILTILACLPFPAQDWGVWLLHTTIFSLALAGSVLLSIAYWVSGSVPRFWVALIGGGAFLTLFLSLFSIPLALTIGSFLMVLPVFAFGIYAYTGVLIFQGVVAVTAGLTYKEAIEHAKAAFGHFATMSGWIWLGVGIIVGLGPALGFPLGLPLFYALVTLGILTIAWGVGTKAAQAVAYVVLQVFAVALIVYAVILILKANGLWYGYFQIFFYAGALILLLIVLKYMRWGRLTIQPVLGLATSFLVFIGVIIHHPDFRPYLAPYFGVPGYIQEAREAFEKKKMGFEEVEARRLREKIEGAMDQAQLEGFLGELENLEKSYPGIEPAIEKARKEGKEVLERLKEKSKRR